MRTIITFVIVVTLLVLGVGWMLTLMPWLP